MKKLLLLSGMLTLILVSCVKDNHPVTPPPPPTVEELLTGKAWKADEIRIQLSDGNKVYYKRGSVGTVYDTDSIRFNTNNTGVYYYDNQEYSTSWQFTNAAKDKMTIEIAYPNPITIFWENIHVTTGYVKYSQYTEAGEVTYLASGTRVPN